jgi:hypothetical protein
LVSLTALTACKPAYLPAGNILFSLENPRGVISLASAMVLIHVLGSYQVGLILALQGHCNTEAGHVP